MTLRSNIILFFTVATTLLLSLAFVLIFFLNQRYTEREFFQRLRERANVAAQAFLEKDELGQKIYEEVLRQHLRKLPAEEEYFVRLDAEETIVNPLPAFIDAALVEKVRQAAYAEFSRGEIAGIGLKYVDNQGIYAVFVTAIDRYGQQKMRNLRQIMGITLLVYLAVAYLVARWYAQRILLPVKKVVDRMKEINTANLHLRIETNDKRDDELTRLSHTFNRMLDRLETSIEAQNNFIGNASHQLKNPLTAILGEVENTLKAEREPAEYRQAMENIGQAAARLEALVLRLLRLAHTGDQLEAAAHADFRIDELLFELKEEFDAVAAGARLRIDFSGFPEQADELMILGNRHLLKIALSNIVENAFKFSNQQNVELDLRLSPHAILIAIKDQGIGIPSEALNNIFEPFFRADNARAFPGFGIGLPLARRIIQMHNGQVRITSQLGKGTVFEVSLPRKTY
jgi:signal transduction histidine kinase